MGLGLSQQNLQEVQTQHTPCGPRGSAGQGGWKHQERGSQAGTGFTGPLALGTPQNVLEAVFLPKGFVLQFMPRGTDKSSDSFFQKTFNNSLRKLQLVNSVTAATTSSVGGQAADTALGC